MAGHSQFKNIMYRKGAQDARRAKLFTKLIRELTVAARSGSPEPAMNPRLRSALAAAKVANMPKDTFERAIRRGAGGDQDANFEEVRYEGYGPGGVAIIVEALTDNRNRTAAETRAAFGKHGGTLGESGSVNFLFERIGLIHYGADDVAGDELFEAAADAGALDVESGEGGHDIACGPQDLSVVRDSLEARFGAPDSARLDWRPHSTVAVENSDAETLFRLLGVLDECDDVQHVAANYEVADELLARLAN